jgi:hypothetical protein
VPAASGFPAFAPAQVSLSGQTQYPAGGTVAAHGMQHPRRVTYFLLVNGAKRFFSA